MAFHFFPIYDCSALKSSVLSRVVPFRYFLTLQFSSSLLSHFSIYGLQWKLSICNRGYKSMTGLIFTAEGENWKFTLYAGTKNITSICWTKLMQYSYLFYVLCSTLYSNGISMVSNEPELAINSTSLRRRKPLYWRSLLLSV